MDGGGFSGMGHEQVTPDHGSEERRQMLIEAYYRNRAGYMKAKEAGDISECCRLRGDAQRFRQLLRLLLGQNASPRREINKSCFRCKFLSIF